MAHSVKAPTSTTLTAQNSGNQATGITQSGQCADAGINVGGQNLGVVNLGNGNKSVLNNGAVNGVLIQNLGSKAAAAKDGVAGEKGYGKGDVTTTINATNNTGNANGQAAVGKGSKPSQNSTQTFILPSSTLPTQWSTWSSPVSAASYRGARF